MLNINIHLVITHMRDHSGLIAGIKLRSQAMRHIKIKSDLPNSIITTAQKVANNGKNKRRK